ncbi:hypothetical protein [Magnetospira sp. QH-2]|uniref:hypothetical protein n=1 Tax=Magnetospira sp. (strain QH-2) TaxID=1288970 RepID=UPI0003E80D32|nr:hypothetical protein [Magnetospira sp. QH-2]CCQ74726.1 conserved protein of unknown function [Magnetospira sp. QH-2]
MSPWGRKPGPSASPWDRLSRPHEHALRFLGRHLLYGLAAGWTLGICMLVADMGGIWSMISRSEDWFIWLFLLFFGLTVTFGSVGMGIGVMSLGRERD